MLRTQVVAEALVAATQVARVQATLAAKVKIMEAIIFGRRVTISRLDFVGTRVINGGLRPYAPCCQIRYGEYYVDKSSQFIAARCVISLLI